MFLRSRSPQSCLAFRSLDKCRVAGERGSAGLLVRRVSKNDFCKRSVTELRSVACVASAYGSTPKNVLQGTFKKLRRAASTTLFERMSERLARTSQFQFVDKREFQMASAKSSWRPLSSVVSKVLRDVRVTPVANPQPQTVRLQ